MANHLTPPVRTAPRAPSSSSASCPAEEPPRAPAWGRPRSPTAADRRRRPPRPPPTSLCPSQRRCVASRPRRAPVPRSARPAVARWRACGVQARVGARAAFHRDEEPRRRGRRAFSSSRAACSRPAQLSLGPALRVVLPAERVAPPARHRGRTQRAVPAIVPAIGARRRNTSAAVRQSEVPPAAETWRNEIVLRVLAASSCAAASARSRVASGRRRGLCHSWPPRPAVRPRQARPLLSTPKKIECEDARRSDDYGRRGRQQAPRRPRRARAPRRRRRLRSARSSSAAALRRRLRIPASARWSSRRRRAAEAAAEAAAAAAEAVGAAAAEAVGAAAGAASAVASAVESLTDPALAAVEASTGAVLVAHVRVRVRRPLLLDGGGARGRRRRVRQEQRAARTHAHRPRAAQRRLARVGRLRRRAPRSSPTSARRSAGTCASTGGARRGRC